MVCEPDLDSLDEETLKPLQVKYDGDEEWREMREMEVLESYREARIPSNTLFIRGDDGVTRTLGTLVSWNGRECPFAAFSEPVKREGRMESIEKTLVEQESRQQTATKVFIYGLDKCMEEMQKMKLEVKKSLEVLDDRYSQLVTILSAAVVREEPQD
ncbi:hypothetical protein PMAYCL1PPCAC_19406, partial [Pristionchus mayeri]